MKREAYEQANSLQTKIDQIKRRIAFLKTTDTIKFYNSTDPKESVFLFKDDELSDDKELYSEIFNIIWQFYDKKSAEYVKLFDEL